MNSSKLWPVGLILAVSASHSACASAAGDSENGQPETPADTGSAEVTRITNVETVLVEPTEFTEYIRITGEAEAFHDIVLSTEESGVVTEFLADKGDRVRADQVIARIDSRALAAQVEEARASAALAQEQFERQRRLWEDEGMGTEIAFLQAKYQAEIAQARLATLEVRLDKTEIRSPVSGVFDNQFVEAGEIALPGTQIARVVSTDRIKVTGGVPERFAAVVEPGNRARIQFDILPGRDFEGLIEFVGSSVDEQNRTFPIEIVMRNPSRIVKPRMVANVRLVRAALSDVIVASQDVIRRGESGYHVFVVEEREGEPYSRAKPVELGATSGDRVVIESGLEAGDRLITLGSQLVDNESRVRIVNDTTNVESEGTR